MSDPLADTLAGLVAGAADVRVVDVGGGSGTRAVPLAVRGCRVTVVDSSTDALASLRRRAAEAGVADRVRAVQADADQLAEVLPAASADFVVCHNVVETVEDPAAALAAIAAVLRPGGRVSVLVAGRLCAVLGHALAGRMRAAEAVLRDPAGRADSSDPKRRFDADSLSVLLTEAGLMVESVTGIGVVAGLAAAAGRPVPTDDAGALAAMEVLLGEHPVLRQVAGDLHAVARRSDS